MLFPKYKEVVKRRSEKIGVPAAWISESFFKSVELQFGQLM
jgi:hypothetical protein